ncbi:SulP family inorganic anion transporter [Streptomyces sp. NPDC045470]|uniref:SulP family inorganic anion transporter n=1 Tax=unclassified Streptomyces TaxID=2593676 RepID=UPI0033DC03B5
MRHAPTANLMAGVTVAVAALPMALGYGVAAGLGAEAGLVSAVIAGATAALLGGSTWQITGPTGVMAVVLLPVARTHGADGVLTCGLLAGLVLLVLALLGAARFAHLVPLPVLTGFITGSAVVITCQQLPPALGGATSGEHGVVPGAARALAQAGADAVAPAAVTAAVLAVCLGGHRLRPGWPWPLLTIAAATAVAPLLPWPLADIGPLPTGVPPPSLDFVHWETVPGLLPSVFTVAALGALEAQMTAFAADTLTGASHRHDGDRVLFGQAAANLLTPLFGGMAATGTVCRTGINVRSGATTRLAALCNSTVIALAVLAAAPLVSAIPLAALAGVLMATAWRMIDIRTLRCMARSGYGSLAVTVLTVGITAAVDLVTAVAAGVLLTALLALRAVTRTATLDHRPVPFPRQGPAHNGTSPNRPTAAAVYRLRGPLLFTTAQRLLEPVRRSQAAVVIADFADVTAWDTTGILALDHTVDTHHAGNAQLLLYGLPPALQRQLGALGTLDKVRAEEGPFTTDSTVDSVCDGQPGTPLDKSSGS